MHLATYVHLLEEGSTTLGHSYHVLAEGHSEEPEVVAQANRFQAQCEEHARRLGPARQRYGDHPAVKLWMHLDERSCAYFALGMAKANPSSPVAILCSSGTAAVNFAHAATAHLDELPPLARVYGSGQPRKHGFATS